MSASSVGRCVYCADRVMEDSDTKTRFCNRPEGRPCSRGPVLYTGDPQQLVDLGLLPCPNRVPAR